MSQLNITILQSPLAWENKSENLINFESKIKALPKEAELVIMPETFNTGFSMKPSQLAEPMDGETVGWMRKMASTYKIILAGSILIEEKGKYYNRFIWMQPNGEFGKYDKRHLFSFGGEDDAFTPGNARLITSLKGWKICTQICYDLRFPVWNRLTKKDEYDIFLIVANWPEKRSHAWKSLLMARAIENQCFVIGVNRIGIDGNGIEYIGESCVINPLGEIICTEAINEAVLNTILDKTVLEEVRNKFPFAQDKDDFIIV